MHQCDHAGLWLFSNETPNAEQAYSAKGSGVVDDNGFPCLEAPGSVPLISRLLVIFRLSVWGSLAAN